VSVVRISKQKRAPSDGTKFTQGLVAQDVEGAMKHHVQRLSALFASLAGLIALAMAGGASLKGW
jgi:hypothetical protein